MSHVKANLISKTSDTTVRVAHNSTVLTVQNECGYMKLLNLKKKKGQYANAKIAYLRLRNAQKRWRKQ